MLENESDEPCLLSDRAILRALVLQRRAFRRGDRFALLEALVSCSRYQTVPPNWVADEMLGVQKAIETGERVDFNRLFGWKPDRANTRRNLHLRKELESKVVAVLLERRLNGASFDRGPDDSVFAEVGKKVGVPRRTVIDIYNRNGWLRKIKPGRQENIIFGDVTIPRGRRRGRPLLRDSETKQTRNLESMAQLRAENASLQRQIRDLNTIIARLENEAAVADPGVRTQRRQGIG